MNRLQGSDSGVGPVARPRAAFAPIRLLGSRAVLGPMAMEGSSLNHVLLLPGGKDEYRLDAKGNSKHDCVGSTSLLPTMKPDMCIRRVYIMLATSPLPLQLTVSNSNHRIPWQRNK